MNNLRRKNKVLIIGLGNIGFGYDFKDNCDNLVLSHTKSFALNENFNLLGGVDLNKYNLKNFEEKYKLKSFIDIREAMISIKPDIVIISSPTNKHLENIKSVLDFGCPRIIICEKPLALNITDSEKILKLCKSKNTKLFVNYFRRVLPGNLKILSLIKSNNIKTPFQGQCIYSKGLLNSSSHFINMFEFFFGSVKKIKIINKNINPLILDPEPDFELEFIKGKIIFLANKNRSLFLNRIQLIMQNGILDFENSGDKVFWKPIKNDKRFQGYKILDNTARIFNNDFDRIQFHFVNQIHLAILGKENFVCNAQDALNTQKVLNQIKNKL